MTSTVDEVTRSHLIFREVNERIAELTRPHDGIAVSLFICECGDQGCAEALEIALADYDAVRAHRDRFVVAAGHQLVGIEHVVDGNRRFLVVEKGGAVARPRRSESRSC